MQDRTLNGVLTVGALRRALANLDPTTPVIIATEDWYENISLLELPNEYSDECERSYVALYSAGDDFSINQL